ncbi:N-6 DNA methylase [Microbispora hainanensis]|uniref:N-6 DNA methylase n=1 Tax=Microbispora hainanensis TaxID=568844 RepID=UPI0033EDC153
MTAAEISRIAGVTRATVSNWRRRHEDFPSPVGGTDASPLYDLNAVRAWLKARGHASAATASEEFRTTLRTHAGESALAVRLLPLVLVAARLTPGDLAEATELTDMDLVVRAGEAVVGLSQTLPGADDIRYDVGDAEPLRALLHCVRDEGAQAALDVLAERELEDSAATGTYSTPQQLGDLMARLLTPATGPYPDRVLDPACGGGTLLAAAARHGASALLGQDRVPVQAHRTAVRLLLASPEAEVTARVGDSLRSDAFPELTVDGVLCNPPYGDRDWGQEGLAYDPRWAYGLPSRTESELAWVQHALMHLDAGGQAVMLLPPAVASRPSGRRIRAALLRSGALRAVIALPAGAAVPLHIGLHLWVLQRPDPQLTTRNAVLFVDTVGGFATEPEALPGLEGARSRRESIDWDELSRAVLSSWQAFIEDPKGFTAVPGVAYTVPVIDLLDEFVDVTPSRHVRAAVPTQDPATLACRAGDLTERLTAETRALAMASVLGDWRAGERARDWRTATIADLARGGALALQRAVRRPQDGDTPAEHVERPVLTARDLVTGGRATGQAAESPIAAPVVIEAGDVLIPGVFGPGGAVVRVADEQDAGCLLGANVHLLRPDPERVDPWFLAGFLVTTENVSRTSSTVSGSIRLEVRRLRVPLLPLTEQRRYGRAFRRLHELRAAARRVNETATEAANLLAVGLTTGSLFPPDPDSP